MVREHTDTISEADFQACQRARDFSHNVSRILATVADVLQPLDFDQLRKYGFAD